MISNQTPEFPARTVFLALDCPCGKRCTYTELIIGDTQHAEMFACGRGYLIAAVDLDLLHRMSDMPERPPGSTADSNP